MLRKLVSGSLLVLLLELGLVACGGTDRETETSGPVVVASPQPTATLTATSVSPTATTTTAPVTDTPTVLPPSDTPTSVPPSATAEPIQPSDTPSPNPPTATPTPIPPTATLTPAPTATSTPEADQTVDPANLRVELQSVVGGFDTPVGIANAADGSGRLFIVEKKGRIRVVQDGALLGTPFLDIADRVGSSQNEQGLLGLAFHPGFVHNGSFYVNYTNREGDTIVSRFAVSGDPAQADPSSETILLTLDQPAGNHNGGHLAFGPDGYLYIGTGDGGASGDKYGNGQNGQTLLGAMLRLDVDSAQPYAIPPDNPFVGNLEVRDEIWAIGLRNPWRYSFDRQTGDLYIADVGQNVYEEVNFQPAGAPGGQNYGWPIMEAAHCYPAERDCDRSGLALPVVEYEHAQGCSVTGGFVYRGQAFPWADGGYLFGDYCSGRIWGLARDGAGTWLVSELAQVDAQISAFGEDEAGELYLLDMGGGELYKITIQTG